jgi:biopolymer transport protein ExbB/TolQ
MHVSRNRVLISLFSICLIVVLLQSTVAVYAYREDIIGEVERVLKQAATERQQPHIDRDSTDRAIHDITYLIEQSWKAAEKSNHAARKDHAKQAEALLLRSMRIGHFDIAKVNPVLTLIQELVSDQAG